MNISGVNKGLKMSSNGKIMSSHKKANFTFLSIATNFTFPSTKFDYDGLVLALIKLWVLIKLP